MYTKNISHQNVYDIAVIGGGASGLMFAANVDLLHHSSGAASGVILEGTARLGSKLLMSGGGHCNITHGGSVKELVKAYGNAGSALRRCIYRHSNYELASWLESRGVRLVSQDVEPNFHKIAANGAEPESHRTAPNGAKLDLADGIRSLEGAGRIFPASMKAGDILDAFESAALGNGWRIRTSAKVCSLKRTMPRGDESFRDLRDANDSSRNNDCFLNTEDAGIGECGEHTAVSEQTAAALEAAAPGLAAWEIGLADGSCVYALNVVIATGGITFPETGSDGSMFGVLKELGIAVTDMKPALAPVHVRNYPYRELSGISIPDVTVTVSGQNASRTRRDMAVRMTGDFLFTHRGFSGPVMLNISGYAEPGEILSISYNKELRELPKRMKHILEDRARGNSGDVRTKVLASLLNQDDFVVSEIDRRGMVTAGGVSLDEIDTKTMRLKKYACPEADGSGHSGTVDGGRPGGADRSGYTDSGRSGEVDGGRPGGADRSGYTDSGHSGEVDGGRPGGADRSGYTDSGRSGTVDGGRPGGAGRSGYVGSGRSGSIQAGNIYVIGEALEAHGITGGYNLQLCWSTAATAADHFTLL